MITRVRLRNWRSHEETELELGEGTNVLVGIMGSGKSAVLDAITYGLFGTVPSVRNRKINLDDLIRKRPVKEDSAEVEVEFTTPEGGRYIVKRVLERGKGTTLAELREGDGALVNKPKSTIITEDVTSLLQIDYDFFERMIYAEQNQLDRFLTLEPRERRRKVDELLMINKFEKARKNIVTLINRLKDREEDRRRDLKELKEDEEIEALPSLEEELEETKLEKEDLGEKKKEIKPELEEVRKKLQGYEQVEEELEEITRKIESTRGKMEALNQQIAKAEEKLGGELEVGLDELRERGGRHREALRESKEKVGELESEARSKTVRVSELKAERKSLEREERKLEEKIKEKKRSKGELEKINLTELMEALERLGERRENLKENISDLRAQVKNLKKSLKELREAGSTCPICGRPLAEEVKNELIRERSRKLENSEDRISELKGELEDTWENISEKKEIKEKARDLEKDVENLPDLGAKFSEVRGEFQEKSKNLKEASKAEEKVGKSLKEAKKEVEDVRKKYEDIRKEIEIRKDLESAKQEKERTKEDEEELLKELRKREEKYDEELVEDLKARREDLIKRQEHLKTRLDEIKKLIEQREKLVETVRNKKRTLERLEAETEILKESISSLNKLRRALSRSQVSLRRQVIEAINSMMDDIWDDIYPYGDFRRIRLSIEERGRTSDYELQVMDSSGAWVSVEGMTSGGERTCALLALRIAFAVVLAPKLSWLVLDEPTHNLDFEGIDKLSEVLRERVPKIVKQLLLITHERRLESAVSGYLYRFFRDKSRDGPTEVQRIYGGE